MTNETSPRQTVYDMFLNQDLSQSEIAYRMKGKLRPESVRTYVRQAIAHAHEKGLPIRPRKEAERPRATRFADQKTLSPLHVRVGAKLGRYRTSIEMDARQFAKQHNFGNQKSIREMELGFYDFTLSELTTIAAVMKTDVQTLLQPNEVSTGH